MRVLLTGAQKVDSTAHERDVRGQPIRRETNERAVRRDSGGALTLQFEHLSKRIVRFRERRARSEQVLQKLTRLRQRIRRKVLLCQPDARALMARIDDKRLTERGDGLIRQSLLAQ